VLAGAITANWAALRLSRPRHLGRRSRIDLPLTGVFPNHTLVLQRHAGFVMSLLGGYRWPMPFLVQACLDDHTLAVTTATAKEAFAKAVEWQVTGLCVLKT
jgi:hypothetical protein